VWLNDTLVPDVNTALAQVLAEYQAALANAEATVDDAKTGWDARYDAFIANFINEVKVLNEASIAGMVDAGTVRTKILALIDAAIVTATAANHAYTDDAVAALRADTDALADTLRADTTTLADQTAATDAALRADVDATGYLVGTFLGNGPDLEKLAVFYSPDGKTLYGSGQNTAYTPADGQGVRDPSLLYKAGRFYVAYTSNNGVDKDFQVAVSTTGAPGTWALHTVVSGASIPGLVKLWAPQFVTDGPDTYIFFSRIDAAEHGNMWWIKALNDSLTSWTAPVQLDLTNAPTHYIDGDFIKNRAGNWVLFYSTGTSIERATGGANLTGTYTIDRTGNWANWGTGIEGPNIVRDGGLYRLYFDRFTAGTGYAWSESADLDAWTAPADVVTAANTLTPWQSIRHGSYLKLPVGAAANKVRAVFAYRGGARHIEYQSTAPTPTAKATPTLPVNLAVDTVETTDPSLVSWNAGTFTLNPGVYAITVTAFSYDVTGITRTFMDMIGTDGVTRHKRQSGGAEGDFGLDLANFKVKAAGEQIRFQAFADWTGTETADNLRFRARFTLLAPL
jgi:hypothetical protein